MPRKKKIEEETLGSTSSKISKMESLIDDVMTNIVSMFGVDDIYNKLAPEVEKRLREQFGVIPQSHELIDASGVKHQISGATHEMFDTVLNLVNLKLPVFLSGPAGAGKLMLK